MSTISSRYQKERVGRLSGVWLRRDVLVRTGCVVSGLASVSSHRLAAADLNAFVLSSLQLTLRAKATETPSWRDSGVWRQHPKRRQSSSPVTVRPTRRSARRNVDGASRSFSNSRASLLLLKRSRRFWRVGGWAQFELKRPHATKRRCGSGYFTE